MDLQYNQRLQNIEAVLNRWLPEKPDSNWGKDVFLDQGSRPGPQMFSLLTLPGRDLLSRGGKRWRPLLMVLVCETFGGGNAALPLVPLVEFSHNASLIHDDIEDNSPERRGRPAVHLLYGTDTAINCGSFLYFHALSCIDSWAADMGTRTAAGEIYSLWGQYMRRLHLGQAMDIDWHRDFSSLPCIEDYYTMCSLKTGCLARFAAVLGVYTAATVNKRITEKEAAISQMMGEAAEKIGVGFQILDDVKNLSEGIPGKQLGDDIVEGKKSLPILLYMHRYPEKRNFVSGCFTAAAISGTSDPGVRELIQALDTAGILDEAGKQGLDLIAQGRKTIDDAFYCDFPMLEEKHKLLAGLFDLIS